MKDKHTLRKHYRGLLINQSASNRATKSACIADLLSKNKDYQQGDLVMFYAAMAHEVDTFGMMRKAIESGKRICLPLVEKTQKLLIPVIVNDLNDLKVSHYDIKEPPNDPKNYVNAADLSAIIVPGLAFDKAGHRLGHGVGFYDRFLANVPSVVPTIGLAFDFQLTDCLPVDKHDVALKTIITA